MAKTKGAIRPCTQTSINAAAALDRLWMAGPQVLCVQNAAHVPHDVVADVGRVCQSRMAGSRYIPAAAARTQRHLPHASKCLLAKIFAHPGRKFILSRLVCRPWPWGGGWNLFNITEHSIIIITVQKKGRLSCCWFSTSSRRSSLKASYDIVYWEQVPMAFNAPKAISKIKAFLPSTRNMVCNNLALTIGQAFMTWLYGGQ